MTTDKALLASLDTQVILDGLSVGVLIFDPRDKLIFDNAAAREILAANLVMIRAEGWSAIAMLADANKSDKHAQMSAAEIRKKAQQQSEPVPFHMLLLGIYMPCWLTFIKSSVDQPYTLVMIERPDWSALTELMSTFRAEARSAVINTGGHAEFVKRLLEKPPKKDVEDLAKRAGGMIKLISTEMYNLQVLIDLLHRLEIIRTGQLREIIESKRKKIHVADFIEDFIEELNEQSLLDPSVNVETYRDRLSTDVDDDLYVNVPPASLKDILRDLLRNALLYSELDTPIKLRAVSASQGQHVEFSVIDQGYGVPTKDTERVFLPFERARQPQVMRESGYGLSLYLAKAEVETMGGRMWFESEEGVGSTFRFKLPSAT